ncbi:copper chaperone PCu(A)C [Mesocricetibacter intestinalis]|nr:copper chaperone PCu(A)C [Mesocricetibacter intestinalis]
MFLFKGALKKTWRFLTALFLTAFYALPLQAAMEVSGVSVFAVEAHQPTAIFMRLHNLGEEGVNLVMAESDLSTRLELHGSRQGHMHALNAIEIPAQASVELKRGGLHIMLFDVEKTLHKGESMPLTLYFDNGEVIKTAAQVIGD